MLRLATAFLVAASMVSPTSAQQCLSHGDITALGVETLAGDYTVWYSPGHLSHAQKIAGQFAGMRDFIQTRFGVDPEYWIVLLDEEDWNQVQIARPGCLPRAGMVSVFFDMVVLPTPVESDLAFTTCMGLVESLSPEELEELAQGAGAYPVEACYDLASATWMQMLGFQVLYEYFGSVHSVDFLWTIYLNSRILYASIASDVVPALARADSAASAVFRRFLTRRYGAPDVRDFEQHIIEWWTGDVDHYAFYLYWYNELAFDLVGEFGTDFIGSLRARLVSGGIPTSTLAWTDYYEATREGLKSILLEADGEAGEVPESVALESNYPNPFNPSTTIVYALPSSRHVTLTLYDVTGRPVRTLGAGMMPAGRHEIRLDAGGLPSGVYLLRLSAGSEVRTRTVTLIR